MTAAPPAAGPSGAPAPGVSGYPPPVCSTPPRPQLYTPAQVALATFLGSPLAGALLIAGNFRRLGQRDRSWVALAAGLGFTLTVLVLAYLLPERFPSSVLPAAYTGVLWAITGQLFGPYPAGATGPSWWRPVLVGGASLIGLCVVLVSALLVLLVVGPPGITDRVLDQVTVEKGKVVSFEDGATRSDARELGQALKRAGYFDDDRDLEVKLLGPKGRWKVKFLVAEGARNDRDTLAYYEKLGYKLRDAGFSELEVQLCDESWTPEGRVTIPAQ